MQPEPEGAALPGGMPEPVLLQGPAGGDLLRASAVAEDEAVTSPYSGNFIAVTAATSPYADPSNFVEEGVPKNAEFLTNYPYLEVLARPSPRRCVVYKPNPKPNAQPTLAADKQAVRKQQGRKRGQTGKKPRKATNLKVDYFMQVTTPNSHTETMLGIERALRRLYDEQDENPDRLAGGLHAQQVHVLKVSGAAVDDGRARPSSTYTEKVMPPRGRADTRGRKNLWIHVTHLEDVPSDKSHFQTPDNMP